MTFSGVQYDDEALDIEHEVSHEGEKAEPAAANSRDSSTHMGALENNVTSITPPQSWPNEAKPDAEVKQIQPREELTPG